MSKIRPVVGVAGFVTHFALFVATALPAVAQSSVAGPGCHLLMNQAACVACVKRNVPAVYDPQGSAQWCARQIAERRAKGLGRERLYWDKGNKDSGKAKKGGVTTLTASKCISMCLARGQGRTRSDCEPWCAAGCRTAAGGETYCVK